MESEIPLTLKLGSNEIFQGKGQIRRIESQEEQQKVALELTGGYLDIQKIIAHHDEISLQNRITNGLRDKSDLVPSSYKELISDAVYMLKSARETLDGVEQNLPADEPRRSERIQEIIFECEKVILKRWRDLSQKAMVEVKKMHGDADVIKAAKHYTEKVLTPELTPGASWKRSYEKPLGYPGDFEVMNYAYNLALLGDTAYEKFCHRLGTSTGEFISTRMTLVKQKIAAIMSAAFENQRSEINVASLGCGPAQEVANFLKGHVQPVTANFTLIDQDQDALSYAYQNSYPEVIRLDGKASVNCLHATFLEFLAAGNLFSKLEAQDMIYAVGLVDYLTDRRAKRLVNDLYRNLKPGGTLMIGSMYDSDRSLEWQVEFITDWQLEYRDEDGMLAMAADLPDDATRDLTVDSTGHCIILEVTKPL
ncbi:class I SAM-dependent methyltransferase [Sneathiella glossodoripedis]|uniref:class I SAM-dependent methyltransferase n=1 Tax=Sneathiella glossodoripedis TaxID=418853 RepID=UPI0011DDFB8D|nr:class I SAM-dependent methyltransferase [Sneathiella glossodoripedis]